MTGTELTISGLSPDTGYSFRVASVNSVGTGSYSAYASAATDSVTVPGVPGSVSASRRGDIYTFSWSPPADDGAPITEYELNVYQEHNDGTTSTFTLKTTSTQHLNNIGADRTGWLRVRAKNSEGWGSWSAKHNFDL